MEVKVLGVFLILLCCVYADEKLKDTHSSSDELHEKKEADLPLDNLGDAIEDERKSDLTSEEYDYEDDVEDVQSDEDKNDEEIDLLEGSMPADYSEKEYKKAAKKNAKDATRYQEDATRYQEDDNTRYQEDDNTRYQEDDNTRYQQDDNTRYQQEDATRYQQEDATRYQPGAF